MIVYNPLTDILALYNCVSVWVRHKNCNSYQFECSLFTNFLLDMEVIINWTWRKVLYFQLSPISNFFRVSMCSTGSSSDPAGN
jgi:hypothetical protein